MKTEIVSIETATDQVLKQNKILFITDMKTKFFIHNGVDKLKKLIGPDKYPDELDLTVMDILEELDVKKMPEEGDYVMYADTMDEILDYFNFLFPN